MKTTLNTTLSTGNRYFYITIKRLQCSAYNAQARILVGHPMFVVAVVAQLSMLIINKTAPQQCICGQMRVAKPDLESVLLLLNLASQFAFLLSF